MKKILFSLIAVVPLLFAQNASAANPVSQKLAQTPAPTPENVPAPTPESTPTPGSTPTQETRPAPENVPAPAPETKPAPESTPGNVEFKQQNTSSTGEGTFGKVYDVVGDVVMIELENGGNRQIAVSKGERGTLGHLIGQRVVVDGNSFRKVALAPSAITATSTASASRTETTTTEQTTQQQTTQVEQQPAQVVTPAPAPAPEAAPAPAPAPAPEAAPAPAPAPATPGKVIPQTW